MSNREALILWNPENKPASFLFPAFHSDLSPMGLDDPLHHRQSQDRSVPVRSWRYPPGKNAPRSFPGSFPGSLCRRLPQRHFTMPFSSQRKIFTYPPFFPIADRIGDQIIQHPDIQALVCQGIDIRLDLCKDTDPLLFCQDLLLLCRHLGQLA